MPLEARVLLGWIEETQANRYLTRDCDGLTILNRRNDVDRRIIAIFNLIATCRERRLIDGGGLPIVSEIHNGGSCRMLIVNKDSFHRRDLSSVSIIDRSYQNIRPHGAARRKYYVF